MNGKPKISLLVTGSRNADYQGVLSQLGMVNQWFDITKIIHGGCISGADNLADYFASKNGIERIVYRADGANLGKAAGADAAIAFPLGKSKGTWNCINNIKEYKHIPLLIFKREDYIWKASNMDFHRWAGMIEKNLGLKNEDRR